MKATLTFQLPDEQEEYELVTRAGDMESAIVDFYTWLRNERKYKMELDAKTLDKVWEGFHQCLGEFVI